jgi:hypothetical protein
VAGVPLDVAVLPALLASHHQALQTAQPSFYNCQHQQPPPLAGDRWGWSGAAAPCAPVGGLVARMVPLLLCC